MKLISDLHAAWNGLSERERQGLGLAGWVLALFMAWSVLFKPAWQGLQSAQVQRAQALAQAGLDYYNHNLDTSPEFYGSIITTRTSSERLQTLASQAAELRRSAAAAAAQGEAGRPKPAVVDDGSRALVVQALGNRARLELQGTAVWVTVDGVDGELLRQGLKTLRVRWGAHPAQADLSATPDGLRGRIRLQWTAP